MATFISVRGWLATEFELIESFKAIACKFELMHNKYLLTKEQAQLYQKGWLFPHQRINWSSYIFFGADLKFGAEEYIKDQIMEMMEISEEIEGLFYFDDDACILSYKWEISDSKITVKNREII
ncbi:hypothetical protein [Chamaesiphon polymorphus]|uniref:hypothetical protein n=1 Tax=Chamaesiphon polymorphus TaxID=2107691 RepID=UPI0011B2293E|nr:hypothetical protein [Chamaesiphon polymorphus]